MGISRYIYDEMVRQNEANDEGVLVRQMEQIRSRLFRAQLNLIDDECDRKAVLCPRRAGKTVTFAADLVLTSLAQTGAKSAFIAITRGHAKQIMWDELKKWDTMYTLGCKFHETDLTMTFPNHSVIFLGGAETASDSEKYRGRWFNKVIIDEAASFYPGLLKHFMYDVIEPCLHDMAGALIVGGTPGIILSGQFYDMTGHKAFEVFRDIAGNLRANSRPWKQKDKPDWEGIDWEWSFHRWTTADNEAMPEIWPRMCKSRAARGIPDSDPVIQREHFGNWVSDNSSLVYNGYRSEVNAWYPKASDSSPWGLPEGHEWKFVAGVDLGYDDDFDIEVVAYSHTSDKFYHVYGLAKPSLTIEMMANEIKKAENMFGGRFEILVGDRGGLGKAIFASLAETYGVMVQPADKQDKRDYIEQLNSEFRHKHGYVLAGSTLEGQLMTVQWAERRKKEDKRFPNHATDAFLYNCRHALHHFSAKKVDLPEEGTNEWQIWFEEQEYQNALSELKTEELPGGVELEEWSLWDRESV